MFQVSPFSLRTPLSVKWASSQHLHALSALEYIKNAQGAAAAATPHALASANVSPATSTVETTHLCPS